MSSVHFPVTEGAWNFVFQNLTQDQYAVSAQDSCSTAALKQAGNAGARALAVLAAMVAAVATPIFVIMDLLYLLADKVMGCCSGGGQVKRSVLDFYQKELPNNDGVSLKDMRGWDAPKLENDHYYIQWLFPNRQVSSFNPTAPTLDDAAIQAFRTDPKLRRALFDSFQMMLSFYGLQIAQDGTISRAANFGARSVVWLTGGNHNFRRITRILGCLSTLGLPEASKRFFHVLSDIYRKEGNGVIGSGTFQLWKKAARA